MGARSDNLLRVYLKLLASPVKLKVRELAGVCSGNEPSTRTVYRILSDLSLAGVPIRSTCGRNGGFYIEDTYKRNIKFQIQLADKGKGGD